MSNLETLFTVTEAARRLNLSPKSIRRQIRAGDLPAYRLGRAVRIDPQELERWLNGHVCEGPAPARVREAAHG